MLAALIQQATAEESVDAADLAITVAAGLVAFWVLLKLLRLAIKMAFLGALVVAGVAAYLFVLPDL